MANAREYTPDVFLKSPSSPLDEFVGMTSCWQRGWYVAKEAYKRFREALQRKEKLSLASLEYRINSEHGKHTDDCISDYVNAFHFFAETFPNHLGRTKLRMAIEVCKCFFVWYFIIKTFNLQSYFSRL